MTTLALVRWSFLSFYAAIWWMVSRADARLNKITNKSMLACLAIALAGYAVLAACTFSGHGQYLTREFYDAAAVHIAVSCAAALAFWLLKIWPAGDAKLFALLSILLPILDPLNPLYPYKATLVSLINTFIPAAVFIIFQGLGWIWQTRVEKKIAFVKQVGFRHWLEHKGGELAASFSPSTIRQTILSAAGGGIGVPGGAASFAWMAVDWLTFFAAAGLFATEFAAHFGDTPLLGLALCAFSFFVWTLLRTLLRRALPFLAWAAGIFYVYRFPGFPFGAFFHNFLDMAIFGLAFSLGVQVLVQTLKGKEHLSFLLLLLPLGLGIAGPFLHVSLGAILIGTALGAGITAVYLNVKEDPLNYRAGDLRPYLILAQPTLEDIHAKDEVFFQEHLATRYPDGLTREQAAAVKSWCASNGMEWLKVQRTISFAFWIFLGIFATFTLKQDVLSAGLTVARKGVFHAAR